MILTEEEVTERIESPANLLNRLKARLNPHEKKIQHPAFPVPRADDIIPNIDEKISLGSTKSKAMAIMNEAMDELRVRLPEVQRPEKLAAIAAEMNKVITAQNQINNDNRVGQIIVYSPRILAEENFEYVDVKGIE